MYTEITKEIIGRLQYHDIYKHVKRVKDENERIALNTLTLNCSKMTLKHQMVDAKNCEVSCLINTSTGDVWYHTWYSIDSVGLSREMGTALRNHPHDAFSFIHNHPNNGTYSVADVTAFLGYENMRELFVVPNNGEWVAVLVKKSYRKSIRERIYKKYIKRVNRNRERGYVDHRPAKWIFKYFCGVLSYRKFYN